MAYDENEGGAIQLINDVKLYDDTNDTWTSLSSLGGDIYSTTETKIGTWIDGKPIYRKCFSSLAQNFPLSHGISNLKAVVKAEMIATQNSGTSYPANYRPTAQFPLYFKSISSSSIDVEAYYFSGWYLNVILEYTKTTD